MTINIVSNAGPLMVFSKLNSLHLLKDLYGRVDYPFAVYKESVNVGIQHGFSDGLALKLFLTQNRWQPTKNVEIPVDLQAAKLVLSLIFYS